MEIKVQYMKSENKSRGWFQLVAQIIIPLAAVIVTIVLGIPKCNQHQSVSPTPPPEVTVSIIDSPTNSQNLPTEYSDPNNRVKPSSQSSKETGTSLRQPPGLKPADTIQSIDIPSHNLTSDPVNLKPIISQSRLIDVVFNFSATDLKNARVSFEGIGSFRLNDNGQISIRNDDFERIKGRWDDNVPVRLLINDEKVKSTRIFFGDKLEEFPPVEFN
jgi:hypothetical protein